MKSSTVILIIVGIGVVGAVAYATSLSNPAPEAVETAMDKTVETMAEPMQKDAAMMDDKEMEKPMVDATVSVGAYVPYSAAALAAQPADAKTILFFKAAWCPSCRALDADIKANLGAIPNGVTIMEVDYDTNVALRQTYGVTTQHTLVQVSANGEMVGKHSGTPTLAALVAQLQ